MAESRQYELVYVVSPDVTEEGVGELHTQIDEMVTGLGGHIENTDNWGRRRLAYEIGNHREGTYVIELINGPGDMVSEIDRRLKVLDSVMRHLVVRVDEDLRKAQRAREHRQSRQQRRRAARGLAPVEEPAPSPAPVADGASSAVGSPPPAGSTPTQTTPTEVES